MLKYSYHCFSINNLPPTPHPHPLQLVVPYNTDTSRLYDKLKQISFFVIILFFKMWRKHHSVDVKKKIQNLPHFPIQSILQHSMRLWFSRAVFKHFFSVIISLRTASALRASLFHDSLISSVMVLSWFVFTFSNFKW